MRGPKLPIISILILAVSAFFSLFFIKEHNIPMIIICIILLGVGYIAAVQSTISYVITLGLPYPLPSATPISVDELQKSLLSLNSEESPFVIEQKENRLICKWKVVDAKWYGFFTKTNLKIDYQLHLLLLEGKHTVRAIEIVKSYSKTVGSRFNFAWGYFRGWMPFSYHKEWAYGIKEIFPLTIGQLYKINFSPNIFRNPILTRIASSGWTIEPCAWSLKFGV